MQNCSYSKNPFFILHASPRDDRVSLVKKTRDAVLLYGISDSEAEDALQKLLLPRKRLEAEMNWFPETTEEDIVSVLDPSPIDVFVPFPEFSTSSAVARFNALSIRVEKWRELGTENGFSTAFHVLAKAHHLIVPSSSIASLNQDRKISGFPLLDSNDPDIVISIREEIYLLAKNTVSRLLQHFIPFTHNTIKKINILSREYVLEGEWKNNILLNDVVQQYLHLNLARFDRIEKHIFKYFSQIRDKKNSEIPKTNPDALKIFRYLIINQQKDERRICIYTDSTDEIDPEIQVSPINPFKEYLFSLEMADPHVLRLIGDGEYEKPDGTLSDRVITVYYSKNSSVFKADCTRSDYIVQYPARNSNFPSNPDDKVSEMICTAGTTLPSRDRTVWKITEMMLNKVEDWCLITKPDRIISGGSSNSRRMMTGQSLKKIHELVMETCRILVEKWYMYDAGLLLYNGFKNVLSNTVQGFQDNICDSDAFFDYEALLHIQFLVLQKSGLVYEGSPFGRWAYEAMELLRISPKYTIDPPPYVSVTQSHEFWVFRPVHETMKDERYLKTLEYYEKRQKLIEEYERLKNPVHIRTDH